MVRRRARPSRFGNIGLWMLHWQCLLGMMWLWLSGIRCITSLKGATRTGYAPAWQTTCMDARLRSQRHAMQLKRWKEIFPNEDATRFDLVDELYALPTKMPTTMCQFASWLEDWITKLVVADELSAHIEPRRAMAILMIVGKPLQSTDNIFMTEWVAILRESGLRDDVTVASLQEARLKIGGLSQGSSTRTSSWSSSRTCSTTPPNATNASILIQEPMASAYDVVLRHIVFKIVPVLADNSFHGLAVLNQVPEETIPSLKGRQLTLNRPRLQPHRTKRKAKASLRARWSAEPDDGRDDPEESEVYFVDAQTSESDMESDGMLGWAASARKDYKEGAFATVACACRTDSPETQSDTWEWRGPCCLVRVHHQFRRCLYTPNWHDQISQGITVQPQTNYPCQAQGSVQSKSSYREC